MHYITFMRIKSQAWEHKVAFGQGTLNFFQFCGLSAQMFLEILFSQYSFISPVIAGRQMMVQNFTNINASYTLEQVLAA